MSATMMSVPNDLSPPPGWKPWKVVDDAGAPFVVDDAAGFVGVVQTDVKQFHVTTSFRFVETWVIEDIRTQLRREHGSRYTEPQIDQMLVDACTYVAGRVRNLPRRPGRTGPDDRDEASGTDFASIPRFMRWFESAYGRHTLAAIIHDRLITDEGVNKGDLGSDTISDRFFRQMMKACGVPSLKRWIMWAAVAMRSRAFAGGRRLASLVVWGLLAVAGMATAAAWVGLMLGWWAGPFGWNGWALAAVALLMPVASSRLWGEQWGASLVAAVAAPWILPPAVLAGVGYVVYLGIERALRAAGRR